MVKPEQWRTAEEKAILRRLLNAGDLKREKSAKDAQQTQQQQQPT